jgi:nitroreductase|tara:strand:+ start:242 stop:910 length:669 start_codon:yes stop_codon:yes gene_type:complete
MKNKTSTIKLDFNHLRPNEMIERAKNFYQLVNSRRSVRDFESRCVPIEVIQHCLRAAGTAPSGANRQPWHFAVISNPLIKKQIREGAELEEQEFYGSRAPQDWLDALAPLGTDAEKPFLEHAPYLIVIFAEKYSMDAENKKQKNYYVTESVGIATGLLITALHGAGLATLTHTPAPMKFLNQILGRPRAEKPLMILVVGYPEKDAKVPAIKRKDLSEVASFH